MSYLLKKLSDIVLLEGYGKSWEVLEVTSVNIS